MKKLLTTLLFLLITFNFTAQNIEINENIQLESESDYKATEGLVLQGIEWILKNPITLEPEKRKEINGFLIKWMSGSPTVSIELIPKLIPVECPECLMAFLSGWTKYSLENGYSKDRIESALAGVERTIAFYEKNKGVLGKDKDIEKMIKQKQKGKLRKFVESNI